MSRDKDILALNAFDPKAQTSASPELRAAVKRRMRSFGSNSVLFYREPIRMERAEGVWMHDAEGRRYLDVYNNVPSVGHSHPAVVEAIRRQVGQLNTHTRYLNDVVDTYAERLLATLPASMSHLVLTCTGSEANDLALRIAQAATGGTGFVVTEMAYHGNTAAVSDVSPSSRPGRTPPPHVRLVAAPESFRSPGSDAGTRFAADVTHAIADQVCGSARRYHFFKRWCLCRSARFPGGGNRGRARLWRPFHRGRGAARIRPDRYRFLGFFAARRKPRHCHHGQADGQWISDGRRGDAAGADGLLYCRGEVLQHVRRQPRGRGGRPRRA